MGRSSAECAMLCTQSYQYDLVFMEFHASNVLEFIAKIDLPDWLSLKNPLVSSDTKSSVGSTNKIACSKGVSKSLHLFSAILYSIKTSHVYSLVGESPTIETILMSCSLCSWYQSMYAYKMHISGNNYRTVPRILDLSDATSMNITYRTFMNEKNKIKIS